MIVQIRKEGIVTIPWKLREQLGWHPGTVLHLQRRPGGRIELRAASKTEVEQWRREVDRAWDGDQAPADEAEEDSEPERLHRR